MPAEDLLATDRPRLLSWTPLTKATQDDLTRASRRLREIQDRQALETFQVTGEIRYGKDIWLEAVQHLEGNMSLALAMKELYMESETVQEIVAEASKTAVNQERFNLIRSVVAARFPDLLSMLPADAAVTALAADELVRAVAVAKDQDEAARAISALVPRQ